MAILDDLAAILEIPLLPQAVYDGVQGAIDEINFLNGENADIEKYRKEAEYWLTVNHKLNFRRS